MVRVRSSPPPWDVLHRRRVIRADRDFLADGLCLFTTSAVSRVKKRTRKSADRGASRRTHVENRLPLRQPSLCFSPGVTGRQRPRSAAFVSEAIRQGTTAATGHASGASDTEALPRFDRISRKRRRLGAPLMFVNQADDPIPFVSSARSCMSCRKWKFM